MPVLRALTRLLNVPALVSFLRSHRADASVWDPAQDLLVLVDEVAVPVGEYRLRAAGSPGGHNGLKSIEAHLKSPTYPRLRIGIRPVDERRPIGDLADFVLHAMPRDERALYDDSVPRLVDAVECWIAEGTEKAVSSRGR